MQGIFYGHYTYNIINRSGKNEKLEIVSTSIILYKRDNDRLGAVAAVPSDGKRRGTCRSPEAPPGWQVRTYVSENTLNGRIQNIHLTPSGGYNDKDDARDDNNDNPIILF